MGILGLVWAGNTLLEVSQKLLEILKKKKEARRDDCDRFAAYLDHIATCIDHIASGITNAQPTHERCAEFKVYLQDFEERIAKISDKDTAHRLTFWLYRVEAVPRYAMVDFDCVLSPPTDAELPAEKRQILGRQVAEIAARIRATANILRA